MTQSGHDPLWISRSLGIAGPRLVEDDNKRSLRSGQEADQFTRTQVSRALPPERGLPSWGAAVAAAPKGYNTFFATGCNIVPPTIL